MSLMPRDESFFELLEQLAGHIVTCVGHLQTMVRNFPETLGPAEEIAKEEQIADELTRSELDRLDSAFITPIDREDILRLMTDLHTVVETITDLAQRLSRYRLKRLDPEFGKQIEALDKVVKALQAVILHLRKGHKLSELSDKLQEMHRLKRTADNELLSYLSQIFADQGDPLETIKRKELHDLLEQTIDHCENVSKTLQGVILKNS